MGRKKQSKSDDDSFGIDVAGLLRRDSVRAVWGILLAALTVFLILTVFGIGGPVGEVVYGFLTDLVGIGYFLLPFSAALGSYMFFRAFGETSISRSRIGSIVVFLLASIGLVDVAVPGRGGTIGGFISHPLILWLDTAATVTFLLAFALASLVIAFDIHPGALWAAVRAWTRARNMIQEEDATAMPVHTIPDAEPDDQSPPEATGEENALPEVAASREPRVQNFADRKSSDENNISIGRSGGIYTPPPLSLLGKNKGKPEVGDIKANANIIKRTLLNFGIEVEMDEVSIGPTVTRYAMKPAEGVRLSKILALQSNLELALAASPVRIEAPIPGKSLVGIEVPNISRTTLGLSPLVADTSFNESDKPLMIALGRSITGSPHFTDLARAPHVLIAGATGSGKSVMIHDLVVSLLYRQGPDRMRFVMVDPKRVELTLYNSIPHLLTPVITDPKKAILALKWLAGEMDRRYNVLEQERVRDIGSYHENILAPAENDPPEDPNEMPEPMPYIVLIIDELADIMQTYPRELEAGIVRLAQMSRAVGIHLVLSTQRPSVKVITGLIKANIPTRIAFQVASQIDSRTILDMGGAEKLLGAGDMLFLSGEMSKPRRIQSPYITESEVKQVVKHIATNYLHTLTNEIDFTEKANGSDAIFSSMVDSSESDDTMYGEAKQAVLEAGKASTSYLQRKLRIGYARAARLMDILEEKGIIGPQDGSKPREVLEGAGIGTSRADSGDDAESVEDEEHPERV